MFKCTALHTVLVLCYLDNIHVERCDTGSPGDQVLVQVSAGQDSIRVQSTDIHTQHGQDPGLESDHLDNTRVQWCYSYIPVK